MITHIVFFKLSAYTPEGAEALRAKLASMQGNVPMLKHIEVGSDFDRSGRAFDVALYTKFASREDLAAYQVHPFHQDVVTYVRSVCSQTAVVDYEG